MIAVVVVFFLIAAGFAINVAWMQMVDAELRSATDASARAGGEALARGLTEAETVDEVKAVAALNNVGGTPLVLNNADISIGFADSDGAGRFQFAPTGDEINPEINAVRVSGHRVDGQGAGAVQLPFTAFLDRTTFQASKFATAAIHDRDIVLVIDRSGSMNGKDAGFHPVTGVRLTRMDALKLAVQEFRDVIDSTERTEKLGLASYSTNSTEDAQLSFDYSGFDSAVGNATPSGMTNIGAGIDDGVDILLSPGRARPAAVPVLIVLTDGQHNQSRDPVAAATAAIGRNSKLQIHTITFSSGADKGRMKSVAQVGRGKHHHASNITELAAVFDEVARTAGTTLVE